MKLSEIEDGKMKSDRQMKEIIADRKTESCVRYYDRIVSKEWCDQTIDMFEQEDPSYHYGFNEGDNPRKSFTELDIEDKENL